MQSESLQGEKNIPASNKMDGIRCDIAVGFGELGKAIANGNVRDDLNDERELAKYIVENTDFSKQNIEYRRKKPMSDIKRGEIFYIGRGRTSYNSTLTVRR